MNSTITLYYECLVEQDRNFLLDINGAKGIETYLQTLTKSTINNFQYVKQALKVAIKIDASQSGLNMGSGSQDLNYVKIQNGNENPCYYFVISKTWKSQNTIELVLEMDTLNTYQYNSDYTIDKKTFIKRMHKDRFTKNVYSPTLIVEYDFTDAGQVYGFTLTNLLIQRCKPTNVELTIISGNATGSASATSYYGTYVINGALHSTGAGHVVAHIDFDADEILMRVIDLKSEEINVPLYKGTTWTLYEKGKEILDWCLYYKNANSGDNQPVDCFLIPDEPITINVQQNTAEFNTGNVPNGKYLLFFYPYNSTSISFLVDGVRYTPSMQILNPTNSIIYTALAIQNDSNTIKVYWAKFVYTATGSIRFWGRFNLIATSPTSIKVDNSPEVIYSNEVDSLPTANQVFSNSIYNKENVNHSTSMGSYSTSTIGGLESIDKTLSTNIKLIHIPYSPTPYTIISNVYTFDSCWTYNSADGKLQLTDFTRKFENHIDTDMPTLLDDMFIKVNSTDHNIVSDRQRWMKDSKLYHSDYFRFKFVYDSFTKIFPMEALNFTSNYDFNFSFDFIMSRNITSKFLFQFNQYSYKSNHTTEDFDNILAVSRNNEEVLYSSQYLDYLRTGYNYDLKAKEKQQIASGIGIGLNVAGLVASIGLSFVPGGQAIGIGGAIAGSIGLASQLVGYAKNTAQNEENIQRKLQETQMQSVAVQNADDYDLLYAYTEDKAMMMKYVCSDKMEKVLDDLFFYCGYIVNEQGIPDVSSRRSFNFLQATLEISKTNNLTNDIIQDIKNKFENGVTFLHYSFNKFDFAQDKENIELSVLPEEE